ncbi:hypothetical protein HOP50_16g76940 [Chloropicon primus]|uniref:Uncharacterized protein n=1 Tax=Chloropicon primus TaxID=1764295 RepID=A0A5B8MXA7_9CHLO|nr:hypothetical protein A3770_16p76650 [Chloropicon primus]UPR04353.1 hypothetical protein HOP50_16g76940 [Chloropicon primus]|eukprot:QDZ25147.1 hypothetical protein A3770_16p76650 [Chloropicon primus]
MESERRSTVSSLKGQLSNVEGSVKSMKAAVVVGSVLTVACLAAVFGVTILANEVSKEVKVSNGTLSTKDGKSVMTVNTELSSKIVVGAKGLIFEADDFVVNSAINAVVVQGTTVTTVCDDLIVVQKDGQLESMDVLEGSALEVILSQSDVESRHLNNAVIKALGAAWKSRYALKGWANRALSYLEKLALAGIGWACSKVDWCGGKK